MGELALAQLLPIMVILILLGCINFVLLKEMYSAYGDKFAFFVNQGVNFFYIFYGGAILYPRMCLSDVVTPEMRKLSKKRFFIMGFLDALGTFFTAMGAAFTPGSLQPIINQNLIPWIMLMSRVYLKKLYNFGEFSGALLIMLSACISALPQLFIPHSGDNFRWYAVLFYAISNVPMAMSACYKERNFQDDEIDVWYLSQWVSVFQFLISFIFVPLLCLPGFGSIDGTPMSELPGQFWNGFLCFLQTSEECEERSTFLLLVGYCAINILYNTSGLYLTKVGSALMNALSYAILLPCTTLLFFTPFVGNVREQFSSYSWFTIAGLVIALVGFARYQRYGRAIELELATLPPELKNVIEAKTKKKQKSFQERIVGAGVAHGYGLDVAEVRQSLGAEWKLAEPLLTCHVRPTRAFTI